MKTFITVISMQGTLNRKIYDPVNFRLDQQRATAFPIIPVIMQEKGKSLDGRDEILVIMQKNEDTERNYRLFLEELGEIGVSEEIVKVICLEEDQSTENGIRLLMRVLEQVSDDSDVYACITYGTKPVTILLTFALIFLEKLKVNCRVQGLYYGEILRTANAEKERGRLYDLAANLRLSNLVDHIQDLEMEDAEGFFRSVVGVE